MPSSARNYATAVIAVGLLLAAAAFESASWDPSAAWALYVALAMLASPVKLRLPGLQGTYSLNFLFVLYGLGRFSLAETLAAGCAGAVVQSLVNSRKRPSALQVLFNVANLSLSIGACFGAARLAGTHGYRPAVMALIACVYFVINTILVSGVLALLEGKPLREISREWYVWSFPYYLIGAVLVGLVPAPGQPLAEGGWLILAPLGYLIHFYLGLAGRAISHGAERPAGAAPLRGEARLFVAGVVTAGLVLLSATMIQWRCADAARFGAYLGLAVLASTLKVRFPGMKGCISVNFVVLLVAIAELSFSEAVCLAATAGLVQSVWKTRTRPTPIQALFNMACLSLSTASAFLACRWMNIAWPRASLLAVLALSAAALYLVNTVLVSTVICLIEGELLRRFWSRCHFWAFPYYLVGAAAAGLMIATCQIAGWHASMFVLPIMGLVYVSYRVHVGRADAAA